MVEIAKMSLKDKLFIWKSGTSFKDHFKNTEEYTSQNSELMYKIKTGILIFFLCCLFFFAGLSAGVGFKGQYVAKSVENQCNEFICDNYLDCYNIPELGNEPFEFIPETKE